MAAARNLSTGMGATRDAVPRQRYGAAPRSSPRARPGYLLCRRLPACQSSSADLVVTHPECAQLGQLPQAALQLREAREARQPEHVVPQPQRVGLARPPS